MKKIVCIVPVIVALLLGGCATLSQENPANNVPAGLPDGISDNQEIGEIIEIVAGENASEKAVVARLFSGVATVDAGTRLVIRQADLKLVAVAEVRFTARRTLGLKILGGDAKIGDILVLAGKSLEKEAEKITPPAHSILKTQETKQ